MQKVFFSMMKENINPIQYGLFLKHYGGGGGLYGPPCNFAVSYQAISIDTRKGVWVSAIFSFKR